jgi:malonate-semialdehyde dehydrogenase (acetylating)/methylmalonate-semialdehyde dehydrogenase
MKYNEVQNFINGTFKTGSSSKNIAVISPLDGNQLSSFNESTLDDLNEIVAAAEIAQKIWEK